MMKIDFPRDLEDALIRQGLVPNNCRLVDVVMTPNAVPVLRYEVYVTHDDLGKLAKAFEEAFETAQARRRDPPPEES